MRNLVVLITLCIQSVWAGSFKYYTKGMVDFTGEPQTFRGSIPLDALRNTAKATMALWVKPDGRQPSDLISIGASDTTEITTSRACLHLMDNGGLMVYARVFDQQDPKLYLTTEQENLVKPNQWNHVAVVIHYNKNKIDLYVNGEVVGYTPKKFSFDRPETPDTDSRVINIGGEEDGKSAMFKGQIANVYVQKLALSSKVIKRLFSEKPE